MDPTVARLVFWIAAAFLVGTAVGSFLNVCIWRMATDRSIIWPGSHCPICLSAIRWYDNIPVLSRFLLGGKCRDCRQPISFTYTLGELTVGAFFSLTFVLYWVVGVRDGLHRWDEWNLDFDSWPNANIVLVLHLYLFGCLWTASLIDLQYRLLPAGITDWGILVGLTASALYPDLHIRWPEGRIISETGLAMGWGAAGGWLATWLLGKAGVWEKLSPFETPPDPPPRQPIEAESDEEPEITEGQVRQAAFAETVEVLPVILGMIVGAIVFGSGRWPMGLEGSEHFRGLGTALLGLTVGSLTVWLTRIIFAFVLAKEAMGMGDVHLMAMVGAFLGWEHAVLAFFLAPFPGLLYYFLLQWGPIAKMLPGSVKGRAVAFVPALATAIVGVMFAYRPLAAHFFIQIRHLT